MTVIAGEEILHWTFLHFVENKDFRSPSRVQDQDFPGG